MLLTKDLIKDVDEKYIDMLRKVNIPEFTKCMAQFSGIPIARIKDENIKYILEKWAENKYRFYKFLGNELRSDIVFEYDNDREEIQEEVENICKEFPLYRPWLEGFKNQRTNKIDNYDTDYSLRMLVKRTFPDFYLEGSTITHFLKGCLNAPEELINKVAAIFENEKISATHTISIEPVDILTASENPYDWQSCYRLEAEGNDDSHADGCVAALLDDSSLITYVWNREGKYSLYGNYELKNIRYKRMRQWISIAPNMTAIHFNKVYPGKDTLKDELTKALRDVVETKVAEYIDRPNKWRKANKSSVKRLYGYGYDEYSDCYIYELSDIEDGEKWHVFNEKVPCLCCLDPLPGSCVSGSLDENKGEYNYSGYGFRCENIECEDNYWCDYCEEYCHCECCEENCYDCCYWRDNHPVCELDGTTVCEHPDEVSDGVAYACGYYCERCPLYKEHHSEEEEEEEEQMVTVTAYPKPSDPAPISNAQEHITDSITWNPNNSYATIHYTGENLFDSGIWTRYTSDTLGTSISANIETAADKLHRLLDGEQINSSLEDMLVRGIWDPEVLQRLNETLNQGEGGN